jgi:uncharacterized protein (TIGR03435 family)
MGTQRMLMQRGSGQVVGIGAHGISPGDLAQQLSLQLGKPVVDKTGLTGKYDFTLRWAQDATLSSNEVNATEQNTSAATPPLFTAIQEQLGLKLEPQTAPMDVLIIDHVEWPQ